ncbi:type VI secretion system domain-containing protein [Ectothiorhodospira sp. BSL-9]|uniref:type VI secretion system domain-containing protein n=1 Tax=Ectothiorhodospira sp. BSL-9 TaxID=1442136 RepID=UPI0009EE8FFB|nr:type VI secretion system domain-containing protein [Ectothiorhodospira sp. BSL-9]
MNAPSTRPSAAMDDPASLIPLATAPLPEGSGVEDPRHHPTLLAIKQAMGRLQGTDFDQVIQDASGFLATQAKDLRVAGFLWLALVTRDQIDGLITGTALLRQLLEYQDAPIHPGKPAQRRAALDWLNSERARLLLNRLDAAPEPEALELIQGDLEHIETCLAQGPWDDPEAPPRWHVLRQWLQARRKDTVTGQGATSDASVAPQELGQKPQPGPSPPAIAAPDAAAPSHSGHPGPAGMVDTATETLLSTARDLHDALHRQGRPIEALAFARAARWAPLTLPPHNQGITRIPPPRPAGWACLDDAQARGDWAGVLTSGGALFFEPGFHLALDLQQRLAIAAEHHHAHDLALDIQSQVRALIQRLPGLETLCFEDGRPFADTTTLAWLRDGPATESRQALLPTSPFPLADQDASAPHPDTLKDLSLTDAWQALAHWPMTTERQRLMAMIARADLCLRARRPDVALPVLKAARAQLEAVRIVDWDPAMGRTLLTRLHQVAVTLDARGRSQKALIQECEQELARLDPQAAMDVFPLPEERSRTAPGLHDKP